MDDRGRTALLVLFAATAATAACGKNGAGQGTDGSTQQTGTGGAGAGRAGGSGGQLTINDVPANWARPGDCHGVGELCPNLGCPGGGAMCQLFGNVCTPIAGSSPADAGAPFCLAFSCMTYEQASCFCTGPAGPMYGECTYGPPGALGLCTGEQGACGSGTATPCCGRLSCVRQSPTGNLCLQKCSSNTECESGCCTDWKDIGQSVCAPASACQTPCTRRTGACGGDGTCCSSLCVTGTTNPDFAGCRPPCATSADCDSGCCQLFANATTGFCTDPGYCGCGSGCAADSTCLTYDGKNFACYKNCMTATECSGRCCTAPIAGKNYGSCVNC